MDTERDPYVRKNNDRHDVISLTVEISNKVKTFVIQFRNEEGYSRRLLEAIATFQYIVVFDAAGDAGLFQGIPANFVDLQQFFPSTNMRRQSLANVVLQQFGKTLNKSPTCSRWLCWPLRPYEILYSAIDSEVLWFLMMKLSDDAIPYIFPRWTSETKNNGDEEYECDFTFTCTPIYPAFSDELDKELEAYEGFLRPTLEECLEAERSYLIGTSNSNNQSSTSVYQSDGSLSPTSSDWEPETQNSTAFEWDNHGWDS